MGYNLPCLEFKNLFLYAAKLLPAVAERPDAFGLVPDAQRSCACSFHLVPRLMCAASVTMRNQEGLFITLVTSESHPTTWLPVWSSVRFQALICLVFDKVVIYILFLFDIVSQKRN